MSEVIKIHNLPGLANYGKALNDYGNNIEAAAKETERQFLTKTDDSVSDAVLAFFEILNSLQSQVFHQAPAAIKQYGSYVQFFENTVAGQGFDIKAWTWGDGKDTVVQKLKVEQVDKIKEVMDGLQPLLDSATEKASFPAVNLAARHLGTAQSNFDSLAENRTGTHVGIEAAHDLFSSNLSEVIASLDALMTVITHAKAAVLVPPTTIFRAIQQQLLTRETIGYINAIENETDAKALQSVLEKKPEDLIKLEIDNISEGTYGSISGIMEIFVKRQDAATLNAFLNSLGHAELDKVQSLTNHLRIAEDNRSKIVAGQMKKLHKNNPSNLNSDEMRNLDDRLQQINRFNGLLASIQELGIGKNKEVILAPGGKGANGKEVKLYRYHQRLLELEFFQGDIQLTRTTNSFDSGEEHMKKNERDNLFKLVSDTDVKTIAGTPGFYKDIEEFTSHTDNGRFGNAGADYADSLVELEKERKKADEEFVANLANITMDTSLAIFAPEVYLMSQTARKIMEFDINSNINDAYDFYKSHDGSDPDSFKEKAKKTSLQGLTDSIQEVAAWADKKQAIDDNAQKLGEAYKSDLLKSGYWSLSGTQADGEKLHITDRTKYYDFNAMLRMNELDQNGLTGFISSIDHGSSVADKLKEARVKVSNEVRAYLEGQPYSGERLTLSEMTPEQLGEVATAIEQIGGANSDAAFQTYMDTNFEFSWSAQAGK